MKLEELGLEPVGSTPKQFDAYIKAEIDKWAPVVKASGAKADWRGKCLKLGSPCGFPAHCFR